MRARCPAALLVAALLLLPVAAATSGEGAFELAAATLAGDVTFDAPAVLLHEGDRAPTLRLDAKNVIVSRYGQEYRAAAIPVLGDATLSSSRIDERSEHGASILTIETGAGAQVLVLKAPAALAMLVDPELRAVEAARLFDGEAASLEGCSERAPAHMCSSVHGVHEFATPSSTADVSGDVVLVLSGPTLLVEEGGSRATYASGVIETVENGVTSRTESFLVVQTFGATGTLADDAPARWFASPRSLVAAGLAADTATGTLTVGLQGFRAAADRIELAGALDIALEDVGAVSEFRKDGAATYAESYRVRVSGDVQSVNLAASPVLSAQGAASAGLAALLVAALGALAYAWPHVQFHATSVALPLYSRLQRPEILDNDVRAGIYEIIRQNPGISARAVHRMSSQSWGTVVYHLRQLERHHLVVSRSVGRTRNYYENHGKYRGMEVQLACLQSPRARTLARLVIETPGISQEGLVERSGLPQPTTSYYIRKLKAAQLVAESREGRYACYHPQPDLERFVQLADPAQPVPTGAPVQA